MNFAKINKNDIANGIGIRVTLFVSGCTHYCKGCFNKEAWDFDFGQLFDEGVQNELLEALNPSYIGGLTLLGGEPMEP
ncbi:MAG: radical SAM protein, partial [Clostridia bacterium]|nr:radical SAM protein [Clostridia bacterium]